jgi:putative ABC transport system permease protein
VVLTDRLAETLGVEVGDQVTVEVREGRRHTRTVPVAGVAEQYLGMGAYMELEAANRLAGGGPAVSGAFLLVDEARESDLNQALRARPGVAGLVSQDRAIEAYMQSAAESVLVFTFILSLFAGVIAFGVVYNSVRISLSERARELASLRVLGFTRGEVAYILLGELGVLVLLAIPVGFGIGALMSAWSVKAFETELYSFPLVLGRGTFALAAVVVLAAAAISALISRRQLNRLDLVGVLKTRE